MKCESAQQELSTAMHEPAPAPRAVREHVEGCARCSAFSSDLHRLHQVIRIEPAPPVPDLSGAIMARVREERLAGSRPARPVRSGRRPRWGVPALRPIAAGLAAGLVLGFVLGSGALFPNGKGGSPALASEIPERLVQAAVGLSGYRATFGVTERNWSPQVPLRTFVAHVAFRAPEDLSVRVEDTTSYPRGTWPRNDLQLVTNGGRWYEHGPNPCPPSELVACNPDAITQTEVGRPPFDEQTAAPTDLIVPMTVLAAADRVDVVGSETVAGRDAVGVKLSYENATPLFDSLEFLGSWRPFYPGDRVVVWLDRSTWFPLRFEVFPAPGPERATWAAQLGIQGDRPGHPSFVATARSVSTAPPPASAFSVPASPGAVNEGFRDRPLRATPADLRLRPGLSLVGYGVFRRSPARPYDESLAAYASGLGWLTVAKVTGWRASHPFGVDQYAELVQLPDAGIGSYEPATATDPRRVALHTANGEFLVSSDLPRQRLLQVASSLPVTGLPVPASWLVHRWSGGVVRDGLTPSQAAAQAPFPVMVPAMLPPGFAAAAAEVVDTPHLHGVTIVYRQPAAELDGVGLHLYQALGATLPPPQTVSEQAVNVRGAIGRWSAQDHLLEWVQGGVYRSITAPSFDLSTLVRIADSLRPERT